MNRSVILAVVLTAWLPTAGPFQLIGYLGPVAIAAAALWAGWVALSWRDLAFGAVFASLSVGTALVHQETGFLHPVIGMLTYSSVALLLLRPSAPHADVEAGCRTLLVATAWISLFEAALGLLQLILSQRGLVFATAASGDYVVGTLGTNSHLFAVKMLFQGLILTVGWRHASAVPALHTRKRLLAWGAAAAFGGALFASALLASAAFIAAVATWYIWTTGRSTIRQLADGTATIRGLARSWRIGLLAVLGLGVVGQAFYATQPANAELIVAVAGQVFRGRIRLQKFVALQESVERVLLADLPTAVFGTGLGRYSSRAAMILSGGYLRNHPDWIPVSRSDETHERIYSKWRPATWPEYRGSIIGMPTSSAQSVLAEFGLFGTSLLAWYVAGLLRRARALRRRLAPHSLQAALIDAQPLMLLCLLGVSFTDVWLEYASFMAPVYLVVVMCLSVTTPPSNRAQATAAEPRAGLAV